MLAAPTRRPARSDDLGAALNGNKPKHTIPRAAPTAALARRRPDSEDEHDGDGSDLSASMAQGWPPPAVEVRPGSALLISADTHDR